MPVPFLSYDDAALFNVLNVALAAWLLLIVGPRWKITQAVVLLVTAFVCALYTALLYNFAVNGPGIDFTAFFSLEGVTQLFATPSVALACWAHYVAGDLWVGRWVAIDAAQRQIPQILMVPILALVCMLGPAGLLVYFLIRGNWRVKSGVKMD
ncbi:hypothetical protein FOA52_013754 [Chlamydomonas sp. UWO 241]|nr:hypothetical protein FOA52_013754 [Chlamydomonas sp. UWO 241]